MLLANRSFKLISGNVITKLCILGLSVILYSCGSGGETSNPPVIPSPTPEPVTADSREPSVARLWNEVLLEAVRKDFARPTIHARNLYHISSAVYDAWATYSTTAKQYLLGNHLRHLQHNWHCHESENCHWGGLCELKKHHLLYNPTPSLAAHAREISSTMRA